MNKPLPCPYCGRKVELKQVEHIYWGCRDHKGNPYKEMVWKCECDYMSFHLDSYKHERVGRKTRPTPNDPISAVERWNKYAKQTADRMDRDKRRCVCGTLVPKKANYCPGCGKEQSND